MREPVAEAETLDHVVDPFLIGLHGPLSPSGG